MKVEKVLSIGRMNSDEKGVDLTRDLSGDERVSMVEELRRQSSKVTHNVYPRRLRRVLEVARQTRR